MHTTSLQVRRDHLATTRIATWPAPALTDGQIRVAVERFALTSNNITYGAFGDAMQYWQFFPVEHDSEGWGHIPVWGFGSVVESTHTGVPVGEHLYGYFPMASDVVLTPGKINPLTFSDVADHRAALHPVYNQYNRTASDPFYRAGTEDVQALLRPLFITSWLIDDFMADNDYFGARPDSATPVTVLLSSASSKTAYGTAHRMHQRGGLKVIGLTSARNVDYCQSLGCYHEVLTYGQLASIDGASPCIYIDFAGNAAFRQEIHAHCRGLVYSCSVGGTHVSELGSGRDLPGPRPTLFFAPAQIKKRAQEWGPQELNARLLDAWDQFVATVTNPAHPWLQVEQHRGSAAVEAAYAAVLAGQGAARTGHMLSFLK